MTAKKLIMITPTIVISVICISWYLAGLYTDYCMRNVSAQNKTSTTEREDKIRVDHTFVCMTEEGVEVSLFTSITGGDEIIVNDAIADITKRYCSDVKSISNNDILYGSSVTQSRLVGEVVDGVERVIFDREVIRDKPIIQIYYDHIESDYVKDGNGGMKKLDLGLNYYGIKG